MKKKIVAVLFAALIFCIGFAFPVSAATITENLYFSGSNVVELDGSTADGSFVSYPLETYIQNSYEIPFFSYAAGTVGKSQKYIYKNVTDLILDYRDYSSGDLTFSITFYNESEVITTLDIDIIINDNNTSNRADDTYSIGMLRGYDNFGEGYQTITPNAKPYIAFSLAALLVKSYSTSVIPTHFSLMFYTKDCEADFLIYGVTSDLDKQYNAIWQEGYDKGYTDGKDQGFLNGYNKGYNNGKDVGISSINTSAIRQEGYNQGFAEGAKTQSAYELGFDAGKEWQHNMDLSTGEVSDFITTLGGSLISSFLYVGSNIEIMGFSLLTLLGFVVLGLVIYLALKLKGSS